MKRVCANQFHKSETLPADPKSAPMPAARIFISCVTGEFGEFREKLRHYLTAAGCDVTLVSLMNSAKPRFQDLSAKSKFLPGQRDRVASKVMSGPSSLR